MERVRTSAGIGSALWRHIVTMVATVAAIALCLAAISMPGLWGRSLNYWLDSEPQSLESESLAFQLTQGERVEAEPDIDVDLAFVDGEKNETLPPRTSGDRVGLPGSNGSLDEGAGTHPLTGPRSSATTNPVNPTSSSTAPATSSSVAPVTNPTVSTAPSPTTTGAAPVSSTTKTPPSTAAKPAPTTIPPTVAPTTAPPTTHSGGHHRGSGDFEALRNRNPLFERFSHVASSQLSIDSLTEATPKPDNGSVGDGQFRVACQYSHFAYDDPIVFPGQPGKSHLHMFFGNTSTNANSTTHSLVNNGGGTCNGFELNRSAYWVPALLDGKGNAVVPEQIILYYKTKHPDKVKRMPQGLKMVAGAAGGSFNVSHQLYWSCGKSGFSYNKSNRVPNCGGDVINASIVFPECWNGQLDSGDHRSHLKYVTDHQDCPASHPTRLPQISILLYFKGQSSVDGWHLSADKHHPGGPPGGALHADWFGGWNDAAMDLWINGCMARARNCSFGQTGTDRKLAKLNDRQNYTGPFFLPLP